MAMVLLVSIIGACSSSSDSKEGALEGKDFLVTIKTDMGDIKAILYDKTPRHKENFLKLVNEGYYDSLLFHRVMQNFMIQGGDPDSKKAIQGQSLGTGSPGYTVDAEFLPEYFHEKGALAAARQPDQFNPQRASSGSQFYIVHGQTWTVDQLAGIKQGMMVQAFRKLMQEQPEHALAVEYQEVLTNSPNDNDAIQAKVDATIDRLSEATGVDFSIADRRIEKYSTVGGYPPLDEQYTIFGQVIQGLDIVDKIAATATDPNDRPMEDVRMYISVEEVSKSKIAKDFNYDYGVQ